MAETKERESLKEKMLNIRAEFRKIMWPGKAELGKQTLTVIVTSLLIGAIVAAMDLIYSTAYSFILTLM